MQNIRLLNTAETHRLRGSWMYTRYGVAYFSISELWRTVSVSTYSQLPQCQEPRHYCWLRMGLPLWLKIKTVAVHKSKRCVAFYIGSLPLKWLKNCLSFKGVVSPLFLWTGLVKGHISRIVNWHQSFTSHPETARIWISLAHNQTYIWLLGVLS